ncbi:DODA-type extradiol aromatic ring-opening family dioxygenase [Effusibacillus pohliae]|uniref:DODA-type extradiol aromatic ring-opening family dioxygenase n=1 Tax=Effusibacillus pohliae TaxID=232270 RepID=UPI00037C0203|nr:class III extradiol ring-cleavage dioxygenase [Effusibacillus pohliae]
MAASFFIAHGSPMLAIEDNRYTRDLQQLGHSLGTPAAIVVFSAHWISRTLSITSTNDPYETIYDFGGFPRELYEITYPARGSVKVAAKVAQLFEGNGIEVRRDSRRGLDHGVWVILRHMFPEADIPVIAASVNPLLPPEEQYRIGQAIAALKNKNIVVIGSGATVHNLRAINFSADHESDEWAEKFDDWLIDHIQKWDTVSLFDYKRLAPHAQLATPDYEHFLPLFIAMGCGDASRKARVLHRSYRYGALSHMILEFA